MTGRTVPVIQLQSTTHPTIRYKPTLFHKPLPCNNISSIVLTAIIKSEQLVNRIATRWISISYHTTYERIGLCDNRGTLYLLDLKSNSYNIIQRTGIQYKHIQFLPNDLLLCGGNDGNIRVYDCGTNNCILTLKGHSNAIHNIYCKNRYLISSSTDCTILWQLYNESNIIDIVKVRTIHINVKQCIFSHNHTELYALIGNDITVYSLHDYTELYTMNVPYQQQSGSVYQLNSIVLTDNNEYIIGGGNSNILYVFNLSTHQLLHTIKLPVTVFSVLEMAAVHHTPLCITLLCSGGSIYLCNARNSEYNCIIQPQSTSNININYAISNTHNYLSTITRSGTMRLYLCGTVFKQMYQSTYNIRQPQLPQSILTPDKRHHIEPAISTTPLLSPDRKPDHLLDINKLRRMLERYGEYPDKHRLLIYRYLLQLPENITSYHTLCSTGIHPAYQNLYDRYPIKSQRIYRRLQLVCSNLANYNTLFSIVEYMPIFIFPFVKSMNTYNDEILFEFILTFIYNICSRWYELYPNVPVVLLNACDQLLQIHDIELHDYLHNTLQCNSIDIFWPHIYTVYQNNLTGDNWLVLIDHLLCDEPVFYYYITVAFILYNKSIIMNCTNKTQYISNVTNNTNHNASIKKLIVDAQKLRNNTTYDIHQQFISNTIGTSTDSKPYNAVWSYLPAGQYIQYELAPKFIVDYQLKQRQIIVNETQHNIANNQSIKQLQHNNHLQQQLHKFNRFNDELYQQSSVHNQLQTNKLNNILQNTTNLLNNQLHAQQVHNLDEEHQLLQDQYNQLQRKNTIDRNVNHDRKYNASIDNNNKLQQDQSINQSNRIQSIKQANNNMLSNDMDQLQLQSLIQQQRQYIDANNVLNDQLHQQYSEQQNRLHDQQLSELERTQHELQQFNNKLKVQAQLNNINNIERIKQSSKQLSQQNQLDLNKIHIDAVLLAEQQKLQLMKQSNQQQQTQHDHINSIIDNNVMQNNRIKQQQHDYYTKQISDAELQKYKQAQSIEQSIHQQQQNSFLAELNDINHQSSMQHMNNESTMNDIVNQLSQQNIRDQRIVARASQHADQSDVQLAFQQELHQQQLDVIQNERNRFHAIRNELYQYINKNEQQLIDQHEQRMLELLSNKSKQLLQLREIWRTGIQSNEIQRLEAEYLLSIQHIQQHNQHIQQIEKEFRERYEVYSSDDDSSSIDTVSTE